MTDTSAGSPTSPTNREPATRQRWVFRACAIVTVLPITVAAVRNALNHWEPTWDAATAAVRVRDVFSTNPPLYGLVASPSSATERYSYLGAVEFHLLALPTRLLGTTWGLLIGIAIINTAAVLTGLWLIRRRVGYQGALFAAAIVSSLLWSFGSEFLVDPTPTQAVALPFFTLLVAAWSVADDDGPAFLVLALVGNYLILTHLAMLFAAPFICLVAVVLWLLRRRGLRRDHPDDQTAKHPARRRWFAAAVTATALLWIPPLYEQLTSDNGNMGRLLGAAFDGGSKAVSATWSGALGVVVAITATPPFWLPPSFRSPPFDMDGGGQALSQRLLFAIIFIAIIGTTIRRAGTTKDRTIANAALIGVAGLIAWTVTWRVNPGADNLPVHYFWGVWPLAAFLWFVIAIALFRACGDRVHRRWTWARPVLIGCASAVIVATSVAALPRRNNCAGRCASSLAYMERPARETRSAAATFARSHGGPILIDTSPGSASALLPALLLGLQDADVEARVTEPFMVRQFGEARSEAIHGDARFRIAVTTEKQPEGSARLLGVVAESPTIPPRRYKLLNRRMTAWTSSGVSLTRIAERQRSLVQTQRIYTFAAMVFAGEQHDDHDLDPIARFISSLQAVGLTPTGDDFDIPNMSPDDLSEWARERTRQTSGEFFIYAEPIR